MADRKLGDLSDKEIRKLAREIGCPPRILRPPAGREPLWMGDTVGTPRMQLVIDTLRSVLPEGSTITDVRDQPINLGCDQSSGLDEVWI